MACPSWGQNWADYGVKRRSHRLVLFGARSTDSGLQCLTSWVTSRQWNLDLFIVDSDPEARQLLIVTQGEWGCRVDVLSLTLSLCFFSSQVLCMISLVTPCLLRALNLQWWCQLQHTSLGTMACLHLLDNFLGTHHWWCPVRIPWFPDGMPGMPPIHCQFHMYFLPLSLETPAFSCRCGHLVMTAQVLSEDMWGLFFFL